MKSDVGRANNLIQKALSLDETSAYIQRLNGEINFRKMSSSENQQDRASYRKAAVRAFNRAIQKDPNNVEAIASAAKVYIEDSRWDKVIELIEVALSIAPSNSSLRKELIRAYYGADKSELAETEASLIRRDAHHTEKTLAKFEAWLTKAKETKGRFDG